MELETILAQIGNRKERKTGAISFPVTFSTAFIHPGIGESTGFDYIRTQNPTRTVLEEAIAEIEGGDRGFAFSSGMAAIQILFGLFKPGDHILCTHDLYGGSYRLFEQVWRRYGITFSYLDIRDGNDLRAHLRPETKAVFIETPSNPMMITVDTESIAATAKEHGALTIVDNTFLTPYYQKPIEEGADIVLHSATKYLGGHNDVLAGLVVTKGKDLSDKIAFQQNTSGAVLSPMDSWLLMRGMKTLSLRMEKHTENAKQLVSFLESHPLVEDVLYPGVGGMISFRVKSSNMVDPILRNLTLISFAESLGGVESLMTYPALQTHADIPQEVREKVGVCDRLLRISTGIEHADDLRKDLEQAFQAAARAVEETTTK